MSQRQKEKEKTTREKKKRRNSLPTLSDAAPPPYPLHFGRSPFPTPKGSPTGPKGKPPRKIDEPQQEREREKEQNKTSFFFTRFNWFSTTRNLSVNTSTPIFSLFWTLDSSHYLIWFDLEKKKPQRSTLFLSHLPRCRTNEEEMSSNFLEKTKKQKENSFVSNSNQTNVRPPIKSLWLIGILFCFQKSRPSRWWPLPLDGPSLPTPLAPK